MMNGSWILTDPPAESATAAVRVLHDRFYSLERRRCHGGTAFDGAGKFNAGSRKTSR